MSSDVCIRKRGRPVDSVLEINFKKLPLINMRFVSPKTFILAPLEF